MTKKQKMSPIVKYGGGFIVALFVLGLIGVFINPQPQTIDGVGILSSLAPTPVVTKAEYDALQTGMTYEQAMRIIGETGEELSRNELAGFTTVMYQWQNSDGSNMNAMFQNGGLIQKAQFGLK